MSRVNYCKLKNSWNAKFLWNTSETCKRSFIGTFLIPVNATDVEKNSGWESKLSNVLSAWE